MGLVLLGIYVYFLSCFLSFYICTSALLKSTLIGLPFRADYFESEV